MSMLSINKARFYLPLQLTGLRFNAFVWRSGGGAAPLIATPWWAPPATRLRRAPCAVHISGPASLYTSWFTGFHHGHFMPDHMPLIQWLQDVGSPGTPVVVGYRTDLPEASMTFRFLQWLDASLLTGRRILWVRLGAVACVDSGVLHLAAPRVPSPNSLRLPSLHRRTASMISRVRPVGTPPRAGQLVVYYSRADLSRRRLPFANEALVLSTIRERMRAHARAETLVTFTGRGETFADQFRTFSRASVVVGAHGGGMMNVVWMQPSSARWADGGAPSPAAPRLTGSPCTLPHVVEFVCGARSSRVQAGCPFRKSVFTYFGGAPWVNFHHVLFEATSSSSRTLVNASDVARALDAVWGECSG